MKLYSLKKFSFPEVPVIRNILRFHRNYCIDFIFEIW